MLFISFIQKLFNYICQIRILSAHKPIRISTYILSIRCILHCLCFYLISFTSKLYNVTELRILQETAGYEVITVAYSDGSSAEVSVKWESLVDTLGMNRGYIECACLFTQTRGKGVCFWS